MLRRVAWAAVILGLFSAAVTTAAYAAFALPFEPDAEETGGTLRAIRLARRRQDRACDPMLARA